MCAFVPHRGTPPLSVRRTTPRSQSKKAIQFTLSLGKQGTRVCTIGPERRVYTIEASNPETEKKEGFYGGGGVYFFPVVCRKIAPCNLLKQHLLPIDSQRR